MPLLSSDLPIAPKHNPLMVFTIEGLGVRHLPMPLLPSDLPIAPKQNRPLFAEEAGGGQESPIFAGCP